MNHDRTLRSFPPANTPCPRGMARFSRPVRFALESSDRPAEAGHAARRLLPTLLVTMWVVCVLALTTAPLFAQSSAPATTSASVEQLKVIVAEVSGLVQVRTSPDAKWEKAVVGRELSAGAEVRTGPRSRVICTIPPDQAITIDRLGTVSIAQALRNGGKTTTELLMKYGRTDYQIEAAGREHDATIRTPNATLAVRGTAFTAYDQPPYEPSVHTYRGVVDFTYAKRLMSVGRGASARARRGPAETALDQSVVDPAGARARTASENAFIANEVSRGAVLGYDQFAQIATLTNGPGPQTEQALLANLPGRLNFIIQWDQPKSDFNLAVLKLAGDPLLLLGAFEPSEVLYPGFGLNTTRSGGRILVDNRGGPRGGQEVGFYNTAENGFYGLQALHASGPGGKVSFSAYLDGKPQLLFASAVDANGNSVPLPDGGFDTEFSNVITRYVAPGDIGAATALIPFPPELLPIDTTAAARAKGMSPAAGRPVLPAPALSPTPAIGPTRPPVQVRTIGPVAPHK